VLGALMNTRGLMELVVLNIGYDLGVLTPEIFAMMVLMALITTFMTGPAIDFVDFINNRKKQLKPIIQTTTEDKILISFGPPLAGNRLLLLANQMIEKQNDKVNITALHLTPSSDISFQEADIFEQEGFEPILELSEKLGIKIQTKYRATNEVSNEIVNTANEDSYDMLLVGSSKPMFSRDETGGKIKYFFDDCNCSVGVLVDRGFEEINNVLLILHDSTDKFLLKYAGKFLQNSASQLSIADELNSMKNDEAIFTVLKNNPLKKINIQKELNLSQTFLNQFDLILISIESWNKIRDINSDWIANSPSILIINK
jgi:hypothetical protein